MINDIAAVAYQTTSCGEVAKLRDRWHSVAGRQRGDLFAPAAEKEHVAAVDLGWR
jgi:hypothetical protein